MKSWLLIAALAAVYYFLPDYTNLDGSLRQDVGTKIFKGFQK